MHFLRLLMVCLLYTLAVGRVLAHDPGLSVSEGKWGERELHLTTGFAPGDARLLLPEADRGDDSWTQADFEAAKDRLAARGPELWDVRVGPERVPPTQVRVEFVSADNVNFHLAFPIPAQADTIALHVAGRSGLPPRHREFITVLDDGGLLLVQRVLGDANRSVEVSRSGAAGRASDETTRRDFGGFFKLGVEHIWIGYDHLLFLFGLLLVCRAFRPVVTIITCFTLAHSLTLALATLGIFNLEPRFVEAAIAASIVFVGVENLWRGGEQPKGRWLLTFGFGLIHGFGFAGVLADFGVGGDGRGIAMPLIAFNLGVESGQVVVAALVLPLLWWLRKNETFVRRGIPILSALVAAAGLFWFLERTLFS